MNIIFLDANNPEGKFQVFQPRVRGLEYSISHYEDHFYILPIKTKQPILN